MDDSFTIIKLSNSEKPSGAAGESVLQAGFIALSEGLTMSLTNYIPGKRLELKCKDQKRICNRNSLNIKKRSC